MAICLKITTGFIYTINLTSKKIFFFCYMSFITPVHYLFLAAMLVLYPSVALSAGKIKVVGLFKDKAIVTIDGKQRVLSKGKTSPEGIELISANSREAIIQVDGEQRTLQLGTHIGSEFTSDVRKKTVTIAPNTSGMYMVNGSINGFQVEFLVDTGATLISMNKHEANRIGLNYRLEADTGSTYTASGIDTVYLMTLDKVRVGDIELSDVDASIHDGDHPRVILLGNSFLGKVDLLREGKLLKLLK